MNSKKNVVYKFLKVFKFFIIFIGITFLIFIGSIFYNLYQDDKESGIPELEEYEKMRVQKLEEASRWVGVYEYKEFINDTEVIEYTISIFKEDEDTICARIDIKSNEKELYLNANVKGYIDIEKISLYLDTNKSENNITAFDDGELLLELEKNNGVILTSWESLEPFSTVNKKDGEVRFVKIR